MARLRVIRDPIYGYVPLSDALARIVDTPIFQRLRRIAQTSLTQTVYPASAGSRFEHALGAMYLATRGWRAAWRYAQEVDNLREDFIAAVRGDLRLRHIEVPEHANDVARLIEVAVAGVALLHDVGHPPFSHALEPVYQQIAADAVRANPALERELSSFGGPFHEFAGVVVSRQLARALSEPLQTMLLQVYGADPDQPTWEGALKSIVAGEVDVDRLDYLMRDAQKAGTEFGAIDFERLIEALELHRAPGGFAVGPGVRARSAVETLLIQRAQAYKWISFHPRVVGANLALERAVEVFLTLVVNDATVDFDGREIAVKRLFAPMQPNLNYFDPAESDFAPALGLELEAVRSDTEELTLELGPQGARRVREQLHRDLQAGVDDAAITFMLKRAALLARTLLVVGRFREEDPVRLDLDRLATLVGASLHRQKNVLSVWKTVEEYISVVQGLFENGLEAKVADAFDEAGDRAGENEELRRSIAEERATTLRLLSEDHVAGANYVFSVLLGRREYRRRLANQLRAEKRAFLGADGFWEIAFTAFQPVRTRRNLTALYRKEERKPLLETSPLVQALTRVEEQRSRVGAFFYLLNHREYGQFDRDLLDEEKDDLTGAFVQTMPEFVGMHLADVVLEDPRP